MKPAFNVKLIMLLFLAALIIPAFLHGTPSTYQASGADGTVGIVQMGFNEYNPGDSYSIILKSLAVSSDYTLDFTAGCADQYNFTTGASETSLTHRVTLASPTTGSECIITLEQQSTGTSVDAVRLQATSITDIVNSSQLIALLMTVVVILIIVGVVVAIKKKAA